MSPDPSNVASLRKFFEEHNNLTTYEMARAVDRSASTIRNWKRKCKIDAKSSGWGSNRESTPFIKKPDYQKKQVEKVTDSEVWDNEEWFCTQYEENRYGIPTIARIIGRSIALVKGRLEKYGIQTRSHSDSVKSRNIYCNKEWLEENYIERGWSLAKCAKEAKVVPYTIYNWLLNFDIEIRDIYEAMAGDRNPFAGRKHSEETKARIRSKIIQMRQASGNGSAHQSVSQES